VNPLALFARAWLGYEGIISTRSRFLQDSIGRNRIDNPSNAHSVHVVIEWTVTEWTEEFAHRDHGTARIVSSFVVGDCDDEAKTQREGLILQGRWAHTTSAFTLLFGVLIVL
jgi:hypothetical protein